MRYWIVKPHSFRISWAANFHILEGMIWSTKHMTELRLLRGRIFDSSKTSTVALGNHCNERDMWFGIPGPQAHIPSRKDCSCRKMKYLVKGLVPRKQALSTKPK